MEANRLNWNDRVPIHLASSFYDVDGFRASKNDLMPVELAELGDMRGKSLLHLQCHFGLGTLSWANRGAIVAGVDFSGPAIEAARALAAELGIAARFIEANVYDLPAVLAEQFEIVFTSYGVLCWLPDLSEWARIVAHFLRPGGTFYIVEGHPLTFTLDDEPGVDTLQHCFSYFATAPLRSDEDGTYAAPSTHLAHRTTYEFTHTLGEIVTALCAAGLRIEFLHEFPFLMWPKLPFMRRDDQGYYRLIQGDGTLPLLFSLMATRPAAGCA